MVLIERKASKGVDLMDADGVNKSADFSPYIIFFFLFSVTGGWILKRREE